MAKSMKPWPPVEFRPPLALARDRRTLEFRQLYPLPQHAEESLEFSSDVYLFFPRSFGISSDSWSTNVFYRNSRVYSRFHAPALSLLHLRDLKHPLNPMGLLKDRLHSFLEDPTIPGHLMTALAQMSGAELTDSILQESRVLKKALGRMGEQSPSQRADFLQRCANFCDNGLGALHALRQAAEQAQLYRGVVHPELMSSLSFAQEYGCAILDECLSELAVLIRAQPSLRDGTGACVRMHLIFAQVLEELNLWRREQGFALPRSRGSEYYSYRVNLLKKEVQRSLYVQLQSNNRDPFYANSAAMVAAGLAAVWATLAQVPLLTGRLFSARGMLLMTGAVGAYILKDRIKDLVKKRLTKRWLPWDHDFLMDGNVLAEAGLGAFQGRVRERMTWLDESKLPEHIKRLRSAYRTVHGATIELEEVLHYHRELHLSPEKEQPLPKGFGVQEIHRIALDDAVRRLDDPTDTVCYFDELSSQFRRDVMPRVYHLNVIQISTNRTTGLQHQTRSRIVLNQKEILRVETVSEQTLQLPVEAS